MLPTSGLANNRNDTSWIFLGRSLTFDLCPRWMKRHHWLKKIIFSSYIFVSTVIKYVTAASYADEDEVDQWAGEVTCRTLGIQPDGIKRRPAARPSPQPRRESMLLNYAHNTDQEICRETREEKSVRLAERVGSHQTNCRQTSS